MARPLGVSSAYCPNYACPHFAACSCSALLVVIRFLERCRLLPAYVSCWCTHSILAKFCCIVNVKKGSIMGLIEGETRCPEYSSGGNVECAVITAFSSSEGRQSLAYLCRLHKSGDVRLQSDSSTQPAWNREFFKFTPSCATPWNLCIFSI